MAGRIVDVQGPSVFGVGDIDLSKLYKKYKRAEDKELQGHLHNNFFHILATLGALGLSAYFFLMYKLYPKLPVI